MRGFFRAALLVGAGTAGACTLVGSDVDKFVEGDEAEGIECTGGLTDCNGGCVDTSTSPANCGECDNACPEGQVCATGACSDSCPSGQTECARACVDLQTDTMNCGACAQPCDGVCNGGMCQAECSDGETECSGACVDLMTSDQNCGMCGNNCAVGQACQGGQCVASCTGTQTECDGTCVDTQSNVQHCGGCGQACDAGDVCNGGMCELFCPGTQTECGGLCIDLMNNNQHCGMCNNPCDPGEVCGNGQCALSCPGTTTACGGSCVDTTTDDAHCGGCDMGCASDRECIASNCELRCDAGLNSPVVDSWGFTWDGLERAAAPLADAETACAAIGARLPTATELFRASAVESGSVGQTFHTNYLWSLVPYDISRQHTIRFSDGGTSSQTTTSDLNYRCVCPDQPDRQEFTGNSCYGPPGEDCFALSELGGRSNIDAKDRAALTKAGAVWECAYYYAHLAPTAKYIQAIQADLENGSDEWLHVADEARYDLDLVLKFSGAPGTTWLASGNVSWSNTSTFRQFRCVGPNYQTGTHPNSISGSFVGSGGVYKGEAADTTTMDSSAYIDAVDVCFDRGGHLPYSTEMAELILQGLPGGTFNWLWTADSTGYHGGNNNFLQAVVKWQDVDLRYPYWYSASAPSSYLSWSWKFTVDNPYRCIYYPLDVTYTGPMAAQCQGSCFELTSPGATPAKLWMDEFDRVPATFEEAHNVCRQNGGYLAHERDYAEAVRRGLPNGSDTHLWTSDLSIGNGSAVNAQIVKWTGTDTMFTDMYTTYMTWSGLATTRPFRCMWSNELR